MNLFIPELINFSDQVETWEEALEKAVAPLVKQNYVTSDYLNNLIAETKRLGAYYVIAPDLALAHIQPNASTLKTGVSLLYLGQAIDFPNTSSASVKFLFILVATDATSHLQLLQEMASLFSQKSFYEAFYNLHNTQELLNLVNNYHLTGKKWLN